LTATVGITKYSKEWLHIRDNLPNDKSPENMSAWSESLRTVRSNTLKYLATMTADWKWENHSQLNDWFSKMLEHPQKKWFVLDLFSKADLPEALFNDMMMAGILELDPSANRGFIEVCIRKKGLKHVLGLLIHYIKYGNTTQKAGAIQARYWATYNRLNEDVDDLKMEFKELILDEFIKNENISVRVNIVPFLEPETYPSSLRGKFLEAASIAREHENEYIRHRIALQMKDDNALTANGLLLAIPKP